MNASQVRVYSSTGLAVGAGFLVTRDVVCTCAHVVTRALKVPDSSEQVLGEKVDIDFPELDSRRRATVVSWRFGGADVALLRLDGWLLDTGPVPLVGRNAVQEDAFKVFGYPAGGNHGSWTAGTLRGQAMNWEKPEPEPRILEGLSGAPVWDSAQRVIGMMAAANPGESTEYLLPSDELVADEAILKPRCPFGGPSAFSSIFEQSDAEILYGRDGDTARVHATVRRQPVTVVAGRSGCGKSTLLKVGVLPRLRAEGMSISIVRPLPGRQPAALLGQVLRVPEVGSSEIESVVERLAELPSDARHELAAELRARILASSGSTGHVIFIDQLEECGPRAARDLLGMLTALAGEDGTSALRIIATAESDFLGALVTADTSDLLSHGLCFLAPLSDRALMQAVTGPVAAMPRLAFEDGLPERIIKDASELPWRMHLVQFALRELWVRRWHSVLTHDAYAEMGGIAHALFRHADGVLQGLSQPEQHNVPELLHGLVWFSEGQSLYPRPQRVSSLAPELRDLAERLASDRIVVFSYSDSGERFVRLPHMALVNWWPLRRRIVAYRAFQEWRWGQLRESWCRWRDDRKGAHLLSGYDLAEALRWLAEYSEEISADERSYILRSRRRSLWRGGWAMQVSAATGEVEMPMPQGRSTNGPRHWQALALVGLWIALLLVVASMSVREVLDSFRLQAGLGPSDTPAVVTAIVALGTATGTLIGVTLTAYAKYVQARGQAEADLIRAKAEMMRAEADVARARAGLPPLESSVTGESSALTSSAEPDAGQPSPPGGIT